MNKIAAERNQRAVLELSALPGNDICADCKARNPRWASHNLGIFICVNCAGIHRKIGTHVTKVKSLTLDSWTKEQVETMKQNGNLKSNNLYNPDEIRYPPPTNMLDMERDSELERYIRAKYEYKKYLNRPALVASYLGPPVRKSPSRPGSANSRAPPSPLPSRARDRQVQANTEPAKLPTAPVQARPQTAPQPSSAKPVQQQPVSTPRKSEVWDDLVSLQTSDSQNASLPLQYQANTGITLTVPTLSSPPAQPTLNTWTGVGIMNGYSPLLATQPLQGDPTGFVVPGQGQFQQQQHTSFQTIPVQPTPLATNPFNQVYSNYSNASLPIGYAGAMGMMPTGVQMTQMGSPHPSPSPGLPQQMPTHIQPQQPVIFTPTQMAGPLYPQTFQPQTPQVFLPQMSFAQPQAFGQPQMFNPTGAQFGGWPQGQYPQAGYQGQQWGGM